MPVLVARNDLGSWGPWPALGRQVASPWAWCVLATLFLIVWTLAGPGPSPADWLGDPDDALRLVTVREFIAGAPWFDTTLPRVGAPDPLLSHWSRLIDAPLALSIGVLTPLLGAERAELATRIIWPVLLFFGLALAVSGEARRRGGPWAAAFALFLVATSVTALAQFRPGRIDHHNVQILCAVAGLLFLVRSVDERRAGWMAGLLLGLGLAIGYEAIALVVAALGVAALVAVLWPSQGEGVARAALAATAVLLLACLATIPPSRWLGVRCDALSLNLPLLAACCTVGLWAAVKIASGSALRLAMLAAAAGGGVALYGALEPACLAGPFGQVSPALKAAWLDHVTESRSLLWFASNEPGTALAIFAFLLGGCAAQVLSWRQRPDAATALTTGLVVLAAALGCWQLKLLPYAVWLAIPPLAQFAAAVQGTASVSAPIMRFAALLLASQMTLDATASALLASAAAPDRKAPTAVAAADPRRPCFLSANVRSLALLPPGLVAANLDLGPYLVALTPHRVVAAPYHRLEKGILAGSAILNGPPDEARRLLDGLGVDYVALCADQAMGPRRQESTTLRGRLLADAPVAFLQEVTAAPGSPIRIWRRVP